jgi:Family of unknown function (DUF5335)
MISETTKSHLLSPQKWGKFFNQLSGGVCTQRISIEVIDPKVGATRLIHNAPLVAMIYNCPAKGGNLVIKVGRKDMAYTYTIDSTTEISVEPDFNPGIIKILVNNEAEKQTLIEIQEQESLPGELHTSFNDLAMLYRH